MFEKKKENKLNKIIIRVRFIKTQIIIYNKN